MSRSSFIAALPIGVQWATKRSVVVVLLASLSAYAAKGPQPVNEVPQSGPQVVANTCIATVDVPARLTDTLVLKDSDPVAGSAVDRSGSVRVQLEYSLKNYVPGQYFIIAQFMTTQNHSTDGDFPNEQYPFACGAQGVITFTFPVKYIWDTPNVRRPLELMFLLNKGTFRNSEAVAFTSPITFTTQ